jgi:cell division protein FtsB
MSNEQKTAIQGAEKLLEQERKEALQKEVYNYLKAELEAVDNIDSQIRKLETEKRAHEENIKNIKQGNLEAIEKRRQSFDYLYGVGGTWFHTQPLNGSWTGTGSSQVWYTTNVAGTTITTSSGKTYIF